MSLPALAVVLLRLPQVEVDCFFFYSSFFPLYFSLSFSLFVQHVLFCCLFWLLGWDVISSYFVYSFLIHFVLFVCFSSSFLFLFLICLF